MWCKILSSKLLKSRYRIIEIICNRLFRIFILSFPNSFKVFNYILEKKENKKNDIILIY